MKIVLPKKIDWFMVRVFLAFAILATLAFVPSLTDFDPTQFDVTGNSVKIKAGGTYTNVTINNITNNILEGTNINVYNSFKVISNAIFTVKKGGSVIFENPSTLIDSNATPNTVASWDPLNTLTNAQLAAQLTFSANTLGVSGPNLTNLAYVVNTNNGGGAALVFGGPTTATASILYQTNITGATTLATFDVSHTPNTASGIKLYVTCTGGSDRVITFPNGCTGAGLGTPPAVTVTNAKAAWFDIIYLPGPTAATTVTNVFWSPVF